MAQPSTSPAEAKAKFAKLSEEFIHETLALSPSSASQAGYHQHVDPKTGKTIALDALLDDVSSAGMAEQRRVYARWRERFRSRDAACLARRRGCGRLAAHRRPDRAQPARIRPHPELPAQPHGLRGTPGRCTLSAAHG